MSGTKLNEFLTGDQIIQILHITDNAKGNIQKAGNIS
jgi:hypothetical protein